MYCKRMLAKEMDERSLGASPAFKTDDHKCIKNQRAIDQLRQSKCLNRYLVVR